MFSLAFVLLLPSSCRIASMCVEVVYFDFQFVSNANYTRVPRGANRTIACLIIIIITPMSHCGGCRSVVSWLWLSLSALDQKLHILDEHFFYFFFFFVANTKIWGAQVVELCGNDENHSKRCSC